MVNLINGLDLGFIQEYLPVKIAPGLEGINVPTKDSDETEVIDFFGAIKKVTMQSFHIGDIASLVAVIESFEGLIQGEQATTYDLDTQFHSSILQVKVKSVRSRWIMPGFIAEITLEVIQGV